MKKMAILVASPEVIRHLLQLPESTTLIGLNVPFDNPGVLELKIEGAGWNTPEGAMIVKAPIGEIVNGKIDWKLPHVNQS